MEPDRLRQLLEASRDDMANHGLDEAEALELHELLGDDPLLQAEMARLGDWDKAIANSVDDIVVPAGLADRLRATVAAELASQPSTESAPAGAASSPSRRRWISAVLATAAVLAVALGLGTYLSQPAVVDVAALQQESLDLTRDLQAVAWQPAAAAYPAAVFPREIRIKPRRWGKVATSLDRQAIVFDLAPPGSKATAAVIAMQSTAASKQLGSTPNAHPKPTTGNVCISSWRHDRFIYTLVVSGGSARYQLFLRDSGSLTANWPSPTLSR